MKLTTFPKTGPGGTPLFWMNEQSGVLRRAVHAYLDWRTGQGPKPNDLEIEILRAYFEQWIDSPVWSGDAVTELCERIRTVKTAEGLHLWLRDALEEGIDPL